MGRVLTESVDPDDLVPDLEVGAVRVHDNAGKVELVGVDAAEEEAWEPAEQLMSAAPPS